MLAIGFQPSPKATDSVEMNDGELLLRYRHSDLIGIITVLDASKQLATTFALHFTECSVS